MKKYRHELIQEEYYEEKLTNGLSVFLLKKRDYKETYCMALTKFGSLYREFIPIGKDTYRNIPAGTAHFLEHMMFEASDGIDLGEKFAKLGCDINAYTSKSTTAYYFSCTDNTFEGINLLLDMFQNPYFEEDSIRREQAVITQELLMYLDKPNDTLNKGILNCLYNDEKLSEDIGGTINTIKEIDKEVLNTAFQTFYHPHNMVLVVVGDIEVDEVIKVIKENQDKKTFINYHNPKTKFSYENSLVSSSYGKYFADIAMTKVAIGVKIPNQVLSPLEDLKISILLDILLDIEFDTGSMNYQKLFDEGVIGNNFNYSSFFDDLYANVQITCDIKDDELFIKRIKEILLNIPNEVISEKEFNNRRRLYQALTIKNYNSIEFIANELVYSFEDNTSLFDYIDILNSITVDDLDIVKKYFMEEAIAVFELFPKKKKE